MLPQEAEQEVGSFLTLSSLHRRECANTIYLVGQWKGEANAFEPVLFVRERGQEVDQPQTY